MKKDRKRDNAAKAAKPPKKNKRWSVGSLDMPFLILVLFLLGFGLVMVCSASYVSAYSKYGDSFYYFKRQAIYALLGLACMFVAAFFDYRHLRKMAPVILLVAFILIAVVLIPGIGVKVGGGRRWLNLPIRIQPSELAKLAIVIFFASYISANQKYMNKFKVGVMYPMIVLAVFVGLVAVEPHLSGAILILAIGVVMLFVGGSSLKWLGGFAAAGAAGMGVLMLVSDYAMTRIKTWLDPYSDIRGDGYQTVQSLLAVGSGGFFGLGLGQSRQKHLYIPEAQNDYIFSIVAEELGFIGCMIVIALFILLIWRGFSIAFHTQDKFGSLIVIGIMSRIAIQTILNIAVVTNAIPVTGIGLPFFSYGGTSLIVLLVEVGIVLSVSRFSHINKT